jgi:antitoxin HicB
MKIPRFEDYRFEIRHLTEEEGGGFLITFPDLPGCMSDGETIEDAIENGRDAFRCWMHAHIEDGRPVPAPDESDANRINQRLPKTLLARLSRRARREGVSVGTLVTAILAETLGERTHRRAG